jgi:hypothetical protein
MSCITGSIRPGETNTLSLRYGVADAPPGTTFTATVRVRGALPDPNATDNQATVSFTTS